MCLVAFGGESVAVIVGWRVRGCAWSVGLY